MCSDPKRINLAHLPILHVTREKFAEIMVRDCGIQCTARYSLLPKVTFAANGQVIALVGWRKDLYNLIKKADYIVADGMSLRFTSYLFYRHPLPERVTMTDFFHNAAAAAEQNGLRFYILGSTPKHNQKAIACLREIYPKLQIVGNRDGYFSADQEAAVVQEILSTKPDVLWVGMGFPKQEAFVMRHREDFRGIGWVLTCGGLFDHVIKAFPRAPLWMQNAGLEWLHRLRCEPRRLFARYAITNVVAIWYLLTGSGNKGHESSE